MIKFYDELITKKEIEIYPPFSDIKESFVLPNAYYINTKGLLYNCFGDDGHKASNLIYTYKLIKDAFYDKKYTSFYDDDVQISLKTELINTLKEYNRILNTKTISKSDIKNYINMNCCDLNDLLLIKLIIGIISSKILLLEKFIELENISNNKVEDINKIIYESNDEISDILIRYCGFHKIESQIDKTITTSSLDLNLFINYLDRDYKVCIIPKINQEYDALYESLVIDKFLEKNPDYTGKIYTMNLLDRK